MHERQIVQVRAILEAPKISLSEVCETFEVSKTTLYLHLNKAGGPK